MPLVSCFQQAFDLCWSFFCIGLLDWRKGSCDWFSVDGIQCRTSYLHLKGPLINELGFKSIIQQLLTFKCTGYWNSTYSELGRLIQCRSWSWFAVTAHFQQNFEEELHKLWGAKCGGDYWHPGMFKRGWWQWTSWMYENIWALYIIHSHPQTYSNGCQFNFNHYVLNVSDLNPWKLDLAHAP